MILDAALEILIESGYAGFTIEGLAARTGVSRPTIYRRWPSRAALATAALDQGFRRVCAPDTGSVREDLRAFQRERMARMNLPAHRPVVSGLVADSVADPDLAAAFADWYQHRHAGVDVILRRAIDRGELPPDVDVDLVKDLLLGPLFARAVVQGRPLEPSLADETTDAVLAGIRAGGLRVKHSGVHDDGNT
jgi:AcrR family transcriptional regulator